MGQGSGPQRPRTPQTLEADIGLVHLRATIDRAQPIGLVDIYAPYPSNRQAAPATEAGVFVVFQETGALLHNVVRLRVEGSMRLMLQCRMAAACPWVYHHIIPASPPKSARAGGGGCHATFSTAPTHQLLGSANAETTPARAPAAAANRKQRPNATCEGKNG